MTCAVAHRDFCSPSLFAPALGSALVLAPPLCVHHPQMSVPHPDEREKKQQLIGAHLLTQAREGYSSHNWGVHKVPVETSRQ